MIDWHKHHFCYDEEKRRKKQNPEKLLIGQGLSGGMVFMDIGSNDGFFAVSAAGIVGEKGRVYALDVNREAVERLMEKAKLQGLTNISTVVGEAEKIVFCKTCADMVFYANVLHDFTDPLKALRNAKLMLKQDGKLVDFDWKKKGPLGPPLKIRLSEEEVIKLLEQAGFTAIKTQDFSDDHYLISAASS